MAMQFYLVPIVEACPLELAIIHPEAGHADDMQFGKSRRAEPGNVASIRRDLGFDKSNMEHDSKCKTENG